MIKDFLTKSLLADVPNLANEFYKVLFKDYRDLSQAVFVDYLNNSMISSSDKKDMFLFFLNSPAKYTENLTTLIGDIILQRSEARISYKDIMKILDQKYKSKSTEADFELFIKENKKCYLHQNVLKAIERVVREGSQQSTYFEKSQSTPYFTGLYWHLKRFLNHANRDIGIKYINEKAYLDSDTVEFLRTFYSSDGRGPFHQFKELVQHYHKKLGKLKENLAQYKRVLEKNHTYLSEYAFFVPLLKKIVELPD
jgi:hypothetical protein